MLSSLRSNDLQIPYIHILFHIPIKKAIRWNLKKKATFRATFSCIDLTLIRFTLIHTYRLMHFVKENHRWLHTKNNHRILSTWPPSAHLDFFQKKALMERRIERNINVPLFGIIGGWELKITELMNLSLDNKQTPRKVWRY